jgi:hypothetical protein
VHDGSSGAREPVSPGVAHQTVARVKG